jgi:hypothetical protein
MPQPRPLVQLCSHHDHIHVEVPPRTVATGTQCQISISLDRRFCSQSACCTEPNMAEEVMKGTVLYYVYQLLILLSNSSNRLVGEQIAIHAGQTRPPCVEFNSWVHYNRNFPLFIHIFPFQSSCHCRSFWDVRQKRFVARLLLWWLKKEIRVGGISQIITGRLKVKYSVELQS